MGASRLLHLDQSISAVGGLLGAEGLGHALPHGRDGATGQTGGQQGFPDLQENKEPLK